MTDTRLRLARKNLADARAELRAPWTVDRDQARRRVAALVRLVAELEAQS